MERLFTTHYVREQVCLDGLWDFETCEAWARPEHYTDTMAVPSCWEMSIAYCQYTGYAAYRRTIHVKERSHLRFVFKGVSHTCVVYLDGKELGGHYSAFSAFSVIAKDVSEEEHILEVLVDNAYSEQSRLHIPNDYFTYGGITRPVFMESILECYIERTEFEPHYEAGNWSAEIRVFIHNLSNQTQETEIEICGADRTKRLQVSALPGQHRICTEMTFGDVCPWEPEHPCLYEMRYTLFLRGIPTDDLVDRIGFRVITLENKKIHINGHSVFLRGVNRHEDHGVVGCAIPLQIMYSDMALIKDLGANAIRTSHYQNDERFLDLCDENGILVWEESHDRGGTVERMTHPLFLKQSMQSMHEMLESHYNHPSIIMWGCLNEAAADTEEGREVYKIHMDYLATDKSRPHTYAGNKYGNPEKTDLCTDLVDISSYNMYPLWYNEQTTEELLECIRNLLKKNGSARKPLIISEYGQEQSIIFMMSCMCDGARNIRPMS